mgnify:CR=1 FL=1
MWETEEGCVLRGVFLWFISFHSHYLHQLHLSNHHSYQMWKNKTYCMIIKVFLWLLNLLHFVTDHWSPCLSGSHLLQYKIGVRTTQVGSEISAGYTGIYLEYFNRSIWKFWSVRCLELFTKHTSLQGICE